ncbi:MAG: hypothetical protein F6J95_000670 [Leptolyngbya sp. SIO1E4]|nr:hypothetical protein [Leptolyngbya sp. SIO1E4]
MFLDIFMGRKNQVRLTLTSEAATVLDDLAKQTDLSRSEVINAIAQGKVTLIADGAQWAFYLRSGEAGPILEAVSSPAGATPSTATPPPESLPSPSPSAQSQPAASDGATASPEATATATINRLHGEIAALQTKLAIAQAEVDRIAKGNGIQPQMNASQPPAQSQPPEPTAAAIPTPPQAETPLPTNAVAKLQQQLLDAKAAHALLEELYQKQQAETARLWQELAQLQQVAAIGENQLNRWQYKTFAR